MSYWTLRQYSCYLANANMMVLGIMLQTITIQVSIFANSYKFLEFHESDSLVLNGWESVVNWNDNSNHICSVKCVFDWLQQHWYLEKNSLWFDMK